MTITFEGLPTGFTFESSNFSMNFFLVNLAIMVNLVNLAIPAILVKTFAFVNDMMFKILHRIDCKILKNCCRFIVCFLKQVFCNRNRNMASRQCEISCDFLDFDEF